MNWGEWYPVPNKIFTSTFQSPITFSKALHDLQTKNKVLPDSMVYFLDFRHIDGYNKSTDELKNSLLEEMRKNDFDNELGKFWKKHIIKKLIFIDFSTHVPNAQKILDSLKLQDLQKKTPKNLFDYEKKKIETLQENHEFLENFIHDFHGKKGASNALIEKYEKLLGSKIKKQEKPPPKLIFEDIIEKTISTEQEFANNHLCLEAVEKDERYINLLII